MVIRILENVDGHYLKVFGVAGHGTKPVIISSMFNLDTKLDTIKALFDFAEIHYFSRIDGVLCRRY